MSVSRRSFLARSLALGCSAAASPLLTPVTLAAAPWDNRLVVIVLRGGMDGLGVVQPYGEAEFTAWRGKPDVGGTNGSSDLDGRFAMHAALGPLQPLWRAGQLGFAHAVSTPYRDKRSHFDGQDILETGTAGLDGTRDGWLNRLLQVANADDPHTAYAVGHESPVLLSGKAPYSSWSPDVDLEMSPQARALAEIIMSGDPAFEAALREALDLADRDGDPVVPDMANGGMVGMMADTGKGRKRGHKAVARFAGQQLAGPARIATFSLSGWDTHQRQEPALARALSRLADVLLVLKEELGVAWDRTAVLAVTEFGRTVQLNGTKGTDHGTGGAMVYAGGALNGGRVVADWPGLSERDLYKGRDLMPTRDLRAHAAWVIRDLFGVSVDDLERVVFPGLDIGARSGLLI